MRRFEFSEGSSNKFWEIEAKAKELRIRFGKLGSTGQLKLQTLGSPAEATASMAKQIAEKTKKGYAEAGGAKPTARVKPAPGVKPTALKITDLKAPKGALHRMVLVDDERGHIALVTGQTALISSDGTHFHRRPSPGRSFGLFAFGKTIASVGDAFLVTTDLGETWKKPKAPASGYLYTALCDSKGNYWLGCDHGRVMTSSHPDKGWVAAAFELPGKVMDFAEIDGKLFVVGQGCGVWDGKKLSALKGPSKKEVITRIVEGPAGGIALVGDGGTSYFSRDRGKTFTRTTSGTKLDLEDCAYVAGALFAVGGGHYEPVVRRSDDEGKTWKSVPFKASSKLWSITSWGDGAIMAGDCGLFALAAPNDPYWAGAKDHFAPAPAKLDAQFQPLAGKSEAQRDVAYAKLAKTAQAEHARISAKNRSARPADVNPQLAAAVDEGTDSAEAVYADWLQDSGDPRGELAQLQLRLAKDAKNKDLRKAEKALLKEHAEAWLGALAATRGRLELEWSAGFIAKARIAARLDDDRGEGDEAAAKPPHVEKVLEWLLASPSARFLRELTIGIVELADDNDYATVAKIIGKHYLPALRTLHLGDFTSDETELNWSDLGNLEPIWAAVPNLETLRLKSGSLKTGAIVLPRLKHFELVTGGMDVKTATAIANAKWPSLEKLSAQVGPGDGGSSVKVSHFQPILDGDGLPRLTHLGITNFNETHKLVEPLAVSKILPQLTELDLRMGTLGDESVARMFALQRAFAHVKLELDDNYIGAEGKRLLQAAKLEFAFGTQRADEGGPEDRYASAYE